MNNDSQLTFMDILSILSFIISCKNLDLNISQDDLARSAAQIDAKEDERVGRMLEEIHGHLSVQDSKLNVIMEQLEEIRNERR